MKKIIANLFLILIFIFGILILTLSSIGIKTNKFNKLIISEVSQNKNINLELDEIKFKIDLKKFNLFLETQNPKINYKNIFVPIQSIKIYIDFLSLVNSSLKIEKTNITLKELDIDELNKLSIVIKPSNFKNLLNNKIKEGKLISEIDVFFTEQGTLKNFIAKGTVKNLKAEILNNIYISKVNLSFFADKNDILIQNFFGNIEGIKVSDGDIKLNLENGIKLNSNFVTKINLDEQLSNKYLKFLKKYNLNFKIKNLNANLNNYLFINLDNTYKVKDYNYNFSGNLKESRLEFPDPIKNNYFSDEIKKVYFSESPIKMEFKQKDISLNYNGKYSFNNIDFLKMNLNSNYKNKITNLKLDLDYANSFELDFINYKKNINSISNFFLDLTKKKNDIKIKKLDYKEKNNFIKIVDLKLNKSKILSFKKIEIKTPNNDFVIFNDKKISIKGNNFDATQFVKLLSKQSNGNEFEKISGEIEIDFKDIKVPFSEKIKNFKLLGEINKGRFIKISSKGDYGNDNYLDISMKKDKNSSKKFLEIYSDLSRPLLTEYSFFKGLSGGKLLFTSIIDERNSSSKLVIEDFKVVNAPGVIKLLSLADLGGLADLAEGEGLSFDVLEISMEKDKNFLKINEILALGPSMSVIAEGYQDGNGLTSLRGTLVPAKTLNKIISKIPIIGNIVIPKEVGEGLFGISFKMKGPKDKIKTTINPLRTITPRFIQKIIDRNKATK